MINRILGSFANMSGQRLILLSLIVTGLYYFMSVQDDQTAYEQKRANVQKQLADEEKRLKDSDLALKRADQIRSSVDSLREQFKLASQELPEELQSSEILKSVDVLARSAGVSIKLKEPRPAKREQILESLPLHLKLQGSFSEVTMFLYYVSILERITRVMSFSMDMAPADSKPKPGNIILDGEITSYRYIGEKEDGKKR